MINFVLNYLIYVGLMLFLAFKAYHRIYVNRSKGFLSRLKFKVYLLTVLTASFILGLGEGIQTFQITVLVVFIFMLFLEGKAYGEIMAKSGNQSTHTEEENLSGPANSKRKVKVKKSTPPALREATSACITTGVIVFFSLMNVLGLLEVFLNLFL